MPRLSVCPFSVAVFVITAYTVTHALKKKKTITINGDPRGCQKEESSPTSASTSASTSTSTSSSSCTTSATSSSRLPPCQVVFVLGGPGSGKGTTCALLEQRLEGGRAWAHLSTGDLLRAARNNQEAEESRNINNSNHNNNLGKEINEYIRKGQLVPSHVTCQLLHEGMMRVYNATGKTKFLIDGFPRSFANATVWEDTMAIHKIEFVLNLECPEEVLLGRLLHRGATSGRNDDTLEVIQKRFATAQRETAPILQHYDASLTCVVRSVRSDKPVEDVYQEVAALFATPLEISI